MHATLSFCQVVAQARSTFPCQRASGTGADLAGDHDLVGELWGKGLDWQDALAIAERLMA
jgi:hypothetical protein